jgi:hypothetical protein
VISRNVSGDGRYLARRQRDDVMIHLSLQKAVQINEVTGDMQSGDLTLPLCESLGASREALEEELALGWAGALANDGDVRLDLSLTRDGRAKRYLLLL